MDNREEQQLSKSGEARLSSSPPLRRLAIVGSHPATRELAHYDDERYEIWLFNESPMKPEIYKRWDSALQMHIEEVYASPTNWVNKDYWEWLQQDHGDKRIFMQEKDPRVPNAVRYPIEGVRAMLPPEYKYIRSSPAYALALAIYLGYEYIELYGSELTSNTEYAFQATNMAFWIGFCLGKGINFVLKCWEKEFYEMPLYGYEGEFQINKEYFMERYEQHEMADKINVNTYNKVRDRLDEAMMKFDAQKVGTLSFQIVDAAQAVGETTGAKNEALRYAQRTDMISRQEFERMSAYAQRDGAEKEKEMHFAAGKCEYVWNIWKQTGRVDALNQLRTFIDERVKIARAMGELLGKCHENLIYMTKYDKGVAALGGQTAVNQAMKIAGVDMRYGKTD